LTLTLLNTVSQRYLEVTHRKGKPLAACYDLPRRTVDEGARVEPRGHGFLVDWTRRMAHRH
jgi:hypothetical protein